MEKSTWRMEASELHTIKSLSAMLYFEDIESVCGRLKGILGDTESRILC